MQQAEPVCIIGAGWAGLAAAVELVKQGIPVRVFESARMAGGRARDTRLDNVILDNGQHLLIGAYTSTLNTLATVGITEDKAFLRKPVNLTLFTQDAHKVSLAAPHLPAPLHLLVGLLTSHGLTIQQRLSANKIGLQLLKSPEQIASDLTVSLWLEQHGQDTFLIKAIWEPLCLAIMNTPINIASARIFMRVLKDSFMHRRADSDLLFSRKTLGQLFVEPCIAFIRKHGSEVHTSSPVSEVVIENGSVRTIQVNNERINTTQLIVATPPNRAHELLKQQPPLSGLCNQLTLFEYEPIATIYLQYPEHVKLEQPMLGLLDTYSQWIIDRASCDQAGLMAVVISSSGEHSQMDKHTLAEAVIREINQVFPSWPEPLVYHVVREKRATFQCCAGVEMIRPANETAINGLWLAGDYTDTGYPATLEGAVRSGIQAAQLVLKSS